MSDDSGAGVLVNERLVEALHAERAAFLAERAARKAAEEQNDRYRAALVEILKHPDRWKRVQETAEKALGGT